MAAHTPAQLWGSERQQDREGKRGALRGGLAGERVRAYWRGRLGYYPPMSCYSLQLFV